MSVKITIRHDGDTFNPEGQAQAWGYCKKNLGKILMSIRNKTKGTRHLFTFMNGKRVAVKVTKL